jgi:5-methylcytosine-specific restriction endonuclease McrA
MPYKNKKDLYSYQIDRWIKRKLKAIDYLGGSCTICGYNKYYGALEFHHKNPEEKDMSWVKLRLTSWNKIVKELDKCALLCANCHRETHKSN